MSEYLEALQTYIHHEYTRTRRLTLFFPFSSPFLPQKQGNIDGAYYGTTFPHLFLMTYGYLKPPACSTEYVPRIFGFRIREKKSEVETLQNKKGQKEGGKTGLQGGEGTNDGVAGV